MRNTRSGAKEGARGARARALLLAAVLLCTLVASAVAGVRNSKHDFSSGGTGGIWGSADTDQVCIFCHTPHNAQAIPDAPLWNRQAITKTFSTYTSSTLNASPTQPTGNTLLCLSCHDGSVAIDAYVAGGGSSHMMAIGDVYYPGSPFAPNGGPNIGGNYTGNPNVNDLMNDHPVSFTYDDALASADGGLKTPAQAGLPLFGGKLECATCHDVHNGPETSPGTKLLREASANSALCLRCHTK